MKREILLSGALQVFTLCVMVESISYMLELRETSCCVPFRAFAAWIIAFQVVFSVAGLAAFGWLDVKYYRGEIK